MITCQTMEMKDRLLKTYVDYSKSDEDFKIFDSVN